MLWLYVGNISKVYVYRLSSLYFQYKTKKQFLQGVINGEINYLPKENVDELIGGQWYKKSLGIARYMSENGIKVVFYHTGVFPDGLKRIDSPPAMLYCIGDTSLLKCDSMAVIGSRASTSYGRRCAERFAQCLAQNGVATVSGMAEGIDGYAQRVVLKHGGKTVAVLGGGVDYCYPESNRDLYDSICKNGLVLSEYPLSTRPQKGNFPYRNRLIIGIAKALLVVEANMKSGTMSTVEFALEQSKTVYAVPGEIDSPTSTGTNYLIQNGALVALCEADILEEFGITVKPMNEKEADYSSLEPLQQKIMEMLGVEECDYETLIARLHISGAELNVALISLEIAGLIDKNPGRNYSKRRIY